MHHELLGDLTDKSSVCMALLVFPTVMGFSHGTFLTQSTRHINKEVDPAVPFFRIGSRFSKK